MGERRTSLDEAAHRPLEEIGINAEQDTKTKVWNEIYRRDCGQRVNGRRSKKCPVQGGKCSNVNECYSVQLWRESNRKSNRKDY